MKQITVINGVVDTVDHSIGDNNAEKLTSPYIVQDDVEVFGGYIDNGDGTFSAPAPDINILKSVAINELKTEHAARLLEYTGDATVEERDTWPIQLEAANSYMQNSNADDELFLKGLLTDAEITAGATAANMAAKIQQKANTTKMLIQIAGKMKRTAENEINAATDVDDLNAKIAALKLQEAAAIAEFQAALSP